MWREIERKKPSRKENIEKENDFLVDKENDIYIKITYIFLL